MKKKFVLILVALLMVGLVVGCSSNSEESENVSEPKELVFMMNFGPDEAVTKVFEDVVAEFEAANEGVTINVIPGNKDYENIMKTKMGANDLPDFWTTHGWSVARYSEYLMPLTDQEWVSRLNPGIEKVVTDANGDVFVLPTDVDLSGIAYNKTVLEDLNINPDELKTWDDFRAACEIIKENNITPIHIGGKESWPIGNFLDWVAPTFLITNDDDNHRAALKDGTFDWSNWDQVGVMLQEFDEKEYFNVDSLSSTYIDSAKNLAQGKAAFAFYGNYVIAEAYTYNENANLGFIPVPSNAPADEPTLISGERTTVGIWKDTEYPEVAKAFVSYLSNDEVMSRLATANSLPAGLVGVESDTGKLAEDYEKYSDLRGFSYFDREFLPSGMWETMTSTGSGLISGNMTPEEASKEMKSNYDRLLGQ